MSYLAQPSVCHQLPIEPATAAALSWRGDQAPAESSCVYRQLQWTCSWSCLCLKLQGDLLWKLYFGKLSYVMAGHKFVRMWRSLIKST